MNISEFPFLGASSEITPAWLGSLLEIGSGVLIGAVSAFLSVCLTLHHQRRILSKVKMKQFEDVLDVSVTEFVDGKMEIRTQLEQELGAILAGEKHGVFVKWIKRAAKKTSFDQIVLSKWKPKKEDPSLVYGVIRNKIYGHFVNVLDLASRRQRGESFDLVRFVGVLTCEPRFKTHKAADKQAKWIQVIEKPGSDAETIKKIRLLLFTQKSIDDLRRWCQAQGKAEGGSEKVIEKLCGEKHVVLKAFKKDEKVRKQIEKADPSVEPVVEGEGLIDQLIAKMGKPNRSVDRKRYVAMAQVLRAIDNKDAYLEFDVPVPRRQGGEQDLTALGGQFFPRDPVEVEARSVKALSFQLREPRPAQALYYQGRNGTATGIVSCRGQILLLRKTLHGRTAWAFPGGFLQAANSLPREELLRELCEEAIDARSVDPIYGALQAACQAAELVFAGPVVDPRNELDAWIEDHVYHLDCSDLDVPLRANGTGDSSEDVSQAQWVPIECVPGNELFASHGTVFRAWIAEQLRRLDAGTASSLADLDRAGMEAVLRQAGRRALPKSPTA